MQRPVHTIASIPAALTALAGGSALALFLVSLQAPQTAQVDPRLVVGAPGGPGEALSAQGQARFLRGRALFDRNFHRSEGLGTPEMNADSCRACHQDPVMGGAGALELNVSRFGFDNGGAGPFQNVPGGQAASKLRPPYVTGREEIPTGADVFEQRQTPSIFGAGLISAIPNVSILANEDPDDVDGDGIRGVARRILLNGSTVAIGRFGWKSQIPTLADFAKDALGGECGITTPDDGRGFALLSDSDGVPDPELTGDQVGDLVFFMSKLAPPRRRGGSVAVGESLFSNIGCDRCHIPTLQGADGPVALYSDLLLHDVMPANFRGMAEPQAGVGMYRTPPLWGIVDTAPYMHDGRAEDLRGAILAHFSEGQAAKDAFLALTPADQDELLRFLEDL